MNLLSVGPAVAYGQESERHTPLVSLRERVSITMQDTVAQDEPDVPSDSDWGDTTMKMALWAFIEFTYNGDPEETGIEPLEI